MSALFDWFSSTTTWTGPGGIPVRLREHLTYSGLSVLLGAAISLPLGVVTGHTGRGGAAAAALSNYWRAIPTLGIVILVFQLEPLSLWPVLTALALVAVPPILLNTDAGLRGVAPPVRDAARGMGMTGYQSLKQVELPLAAPLILTGLRSGTSQVIATASIAAFVGLGGFGRYIIDGYAARDIPQITGGAVLIAALALSTDGAFALVQAWLTGGPGRRRIRGMPSPTPHLIQAVPQPQETQS